jgi:small subunit ribosomal protein S20
MPHIPINKSSEKRARTSLKREEINKSTKSRVKSSVKKFLVEESPEAKAEALRLASSQLDRAANKGVIHPNKANRTKSRLAKRMANATSQS